MTIREEQQKQWIDVGLSSNHRSPSEEILEAMDTKSLVLISAVVFAALFYGLSRTDWWDAEDPPSPGIEEPALTDSEDSQDSDAHRAPASIPLTKEATSRPRQETLLAELEEARLNADHLQRDLQALTEQQAQLRQTANPSLSQTVWNDIELRNLTDSLQTHRVAEREISADAEAALRTQALAAETARAEIDEAIRVLQRDLGRIEEEIRLRSYSSNPLPEDRATLLDLQNLAVQRRLELDDLQRQRADTFSALELQSQNIDATAQALREEVRATEEAVQDRIALLREQAGMREIASENARMSLMSVNQRLEQTQKAYDSQLQRVRDLEAAVNALTSEMAPSAL